MLVSELEENWNDSVDGYLQRRKRGRGDRESEGEACRFGGCAVAVVASSLSVRERMEVLRLSWAAVLAPSLPPSLSVSESTDPPQFCWEWWIVGTGPTSSLLSSSIAVSDQDGS